MLADLLAKLKAAGVTPLIEYAAPEGDAEAADLFARARAGDEAAMDALPALFDARGGGTGSGTSNGRSLTSRSPDW